MESCEPLIELDFVNHVFIVVFFGTIDNVLKDVALTVAAQSGVVELAQYQALVFLHGYQLQDVTLVGDGVAISGIHKRHILHIGEYTRYLTMERYTL